MDIDLEMLNNHFAYYRDEAFGEDNYCNNICSKTKCDCCGNYIDCGNSQSDCEKLEEAKKEYYKLVLEDFHIQEVYGYTWAIDSRRLLGITTEIVNIKDLEKLWKRNFQEIKKEDLKSIPVNDQLIDNKITKKKKGVNEAVLYGISDSNEQQYKKAIIDKSFELIKAPHNIFFSPKAPLIILNDKYNFIFAPRITTDEEDED